jgi:pimeloyl-ACP methyl ester carboxylesterase
MSAPPFDRRDFLAASSAATLGLLAPQAQAAPPDPRPAVRAFKYRASDEALTDLKRRVAATRWPDRELVNDDSQGVRLETMKKVADYWRTHDWRKGEARLNAHPQFITNIDGVDIHFIHVKSKHQNALPLIVTHGWPGSVLEQLKIIGPLTDPTAHGGKAADAFDVVIPSLPGYGFSGAPRALGWDPVRIAKAWTVLMQRLGHSRYGAQGGDWGDAVTEQLALLTPPGLVGIHVNMPATVPPDIDAAIKAGASPPATLSADEKRAWDQLSYFYKHGLGYAMEMANRPQTLYALNDSPIGLAAWMFDHDIASEQLIARVFEGQKEGIGRDELLDNVTLYWLTGTAISSARLYWENKLVFFAPKGVQLPVGVSAFPDEIHQAPESWARRAYPRLVHYRRPPKGGHFAAWEQPMELVEDVRATFRTLRG